MVPEREPWGQEGFLCGTGDIRTESQGDRLVGLDSFSIGPWVSSGVKACLSSAFGPRVFQKGS